MQHRRGSKNGHRNFGAREQSCLFGNDLLTVMTLDQLVHSKFYIFEPLPCRNPCRLIISSISKSYSDGKGNLNPRASSITNGAWKKVHRVSTVANEPLISRTTPYICCVDMLWFVSPRVIWMEPLR